MTEYLAFDGHTAIPVQNGKEALGKSEDREFDLVITDRGMPEMGGDELAATIKHANRNVPVIMLTGFGEMMEVSGERPAGVDLLMSKPVTIGTLRSAMASLLGHVEDDRADAS